MSLKELNQKLSVIARVVVHPKYRSIGLGEKLIRDSLPLVGTEFVEMIAVMPKYNPFAERAGMQKILVSEPCSIALAVASELERLGFDLKLLGSQQYVLGKLEGLNGGQLAELKAVFSRKSHPMFREVLGAIRHERGRVKGYEKELEKADLVKLAHLVRTANVLLQRKVYLSWHRMV